MNKITHFSSTSPSTILKGISWYSRIILLQLCFITAVLIDVLIIHTPVLPPHNKHRVYNDMQNIIITNVPYKNIL